MLDKWTDEQIAVAIFDSIKACCITYKTNTQNQLEGICFGKWHDKCSMHIICIAGKSGTLKQFLLYLKKVFPLVKTITGNREGILVTYKVK